MSKVIIDTEMVQILEKVVNENLIEDKDQYERFLKDLGDLYGDYLGAECTRAEMPDLAEAAPHDPPSLTRAACYFKATESTLEDGGVFALFDTDVSVEEWFADSREDEEAGVSG